MGLKRDNPEPLKRNIEIPPFHVATFLYDAPIFDLADYIKENKTFLSREAKVRTVKLCPAYIVATWERVQTFLTNEGKFIPQGMGISALINYGLDRLLELEEATELKRLRDAIHLSSRLALNKQSQFSKSMKQGSTDFHLTDLDGFTPLSFRCAEDVSGRLAKTSDLLGLELRTSTPLALAIGLATQENIHKDFPPTIEKETDILKAKLRDKLNDLESLLGFWEEK